MPKKINFAEQLADKIPQKQPGGDAAVDATSAKVSRLATATSISAFVAAACLIFAAVTHTQTSAALASAQSDLVDVVIAAEDIPSGTTISKSMLTTVQVPSQYVGSKAISNASEAVGKQSVVRIDANSQVRSSELTKNDSSSSLAGRISKGSKAVSINVTTETDFAQSLLHQGDRVSLYCFEEKSGGSTAKKLIASNVEVLALDGYTSYAELSPDGITASYSTVSVEVSPKKATQIRQIQAEGTDIWMVLTSSADVKR